MALHVTDVEYLQHYKLKLAFNDGVIGVVDLGNALWGEMFEPLSDPLLFSQVRLDSELGTVCWPNGADLAPEFLYGLIHQSMSNTKLYYKYWGKAKPEAGDRAAYHLLPYHCLDVAAVGCELLERHPFLADRFEQLFGVPKPVLIPWLNLLLALHDCGKFAESFQQLKPELRIKWWGEISKTNYDLRHDSLGFVLWADEDAIRKSLQIEPRLFRKTLKVWLQATTGHHGLPPKSTSNAARIQAKTYFKEADIHCAAEFYQDVYLLFHPDLEALSGFIDNDEDWSERQEKASWLLAGFTILCDWLGSDSGIFEYNNDDSLTLDDYWKIRAVPAAKRSVDNSGILPAQRAGLKRLDQLFNYLKTPTPLQQQAERLPLSQKPQLFILEDVTGAGKTEAAMMLAHRLIGQNSAEGVFIGLPTMATANAMYERAADCYQGLYADDEKPSLVLAHSARHLDETFRQSIMSQHATDSIYGNREETASVQCTRWLGDHRKKALLADVGIGTVDQVLLGILPARHQSLRLLGLANKVLIVDEVHAYDAYMNGLLLNLLEFHAYLGGSAVLLSATLPFKMRQAFVKAFQRGAGYSLCSVQKRGYADYPLLTHISDNTPVETVLETRTEVKRTVAVKFVHDSNGVIDTIRTALTKNQCVCWIRNTVFDARTSYVELQQADWLKPDQLILFHSRYTLHDRKTLEDDVLKRFGKYSLAAERQGKVLIATQVVEQSLDLDFDVMISDLAPIDLLIQRAGRLYRHCRDSLGNPIVGKDERPEPPTLFVFSPPLSENPAPDWFKSVFPKANSVYPHTGQLWRTATLLKQKQGWRMPEDARELIETVYQEDDSDIPETLKIASNAAEGDHWAKVSMANMNALKLAQGYTLSDSSWDEDQRIPTRLSEDSVTVYLAKQQEKLSPLIKAEQYAWDLSSIHIAANRIKAVPEVILSSVNDLKAGEKTLSDYAFVLPLTPQSQTHWKGQAINGDDSLVEVVYCQRLGLLIGNEINEFLIGLIVSSV